MCTKHVLYLQYKKPVTSSSHWFQGSHWLIGVSNWRIIDKRSFSILWHREAINFLVAMHVVLYSYTCVSNLGTCNLNTLGIKHEGPCTLCFNSRETVYIVGFDRKYVAKVRLGLSSPALPQKSNSHLHSTCVRPYGAKLGGRWLLVHVLDHNITIIGLWTGASANARACMVLAETRPAQWVT